MEPLLGVVLCHTKICFFGTGKILSVNRVVGNFFSLGEKQHLSACAHIVLDLTMDAWC
jgi:hypothetical protein